MFTMVPLIRVTMASGKGPESTGGSVVVSSLHSVNVPATQELVIVLVKVVDTVSVEVWEMNIKP